jgi:ATP-dependent RNA helicase DHX29
MISVSSPDSKQSEAFIATTALFLLFNSSAKEDKVFLRLPATWRDLWTEFAGRKKEKSDEADRNAIRIIRDMVREKRDRELEDGVLIQGAFRNRNSARPADNSDESGPDKSLKSSLTSEAYQKIWSDKFNMPSYQIMLVSQFFPKSFDIINNAIAISYATSNVGVQK